ncbi:hypothetical protein [Janthinobacterium sp. NKUCC08_JDC]|uniref:hypothetical protein n=1 Tax=Janthinobacterium sp. NKUCC08_JDC TaxID=2842122 RepID=UPI001C5BDC6C|nr:hypothetical protein [Janthinobacterium sp. NKUCC08_JDC]MBW3498221.1 hypothetical protein [Janthinobacterium sp. NKUCC08_JDC]
MRHQANRKFPQKISFHQQIELTISWQQLDATERVPALDYVGDDFAEVTDEKKLILH